MDVTAVINYKNPFVVNGQPVIVSFAIGEGEACNTIFLWLFLKTNNSPIMNNNNALVSGLMGEKFDL